jgi:hypothetical protein
MEILPLRKLGSSYGFRLLKIKGPLHLSLH